jgi:hypothetical protein
MIDNDAEVNEKKDNKMKMLFKFKIQKIDDSTNAMEFTKLAGDSIFFREKLSWMK